MRRIRTTTRTRIIGGRGHVARRHHGGSHGERKEEEAATKGHGGLR